MKLGIRLFLGIFMAATVGSACPENVGTVAIQLVQPPAQFPRPLAGVRQLTLRVERDGRVVKERTFSNRDEFEMGEVGPISDAFLVLEGKTLSGETRRGKAGPIDLGALRGDNPLVVNLFLGDMEGFSPFAEMTLARAYHATATLPGGDVLVTGGEIVESLGAGVATRSVSGYELLDARSFDLIALQSRVDFPNARSQHTATVLGDGRVVLIAGANKQPLSAKPESGSLRDDIEIFDPRDKLTRLGRGPRLSFPRRQHTATLLDDGTILVAGGFAATPAKTTALPGKVAPYKDESSGELVGSAELMDLSAGTTTAIVENGMICPRAGHTATVVPGVNVVVLAGGVDEKGRPTDCVELYYPDQRRFETATLTPLDGQSVWVGRSGMATIYLPSIERLAFFGGYRWVPGATEGDPGTVEPVNFIDLVAFDAGSRKITTFERVLIPDRIGDVDVKTPARAHMRPVALRDGRVLLVGGEGFRLSFGGILPVVDWMYFSPDTREMSFSFYGHTEARRAGHTVDVLPNGELVLIGGEVNSSAHSRLVEWYTPKE